MTIEVRITRAEPRETVARLFVGDRHEAIQLARNRSRLWGCHATVFDFRRGVVQYFNGKRVAWEDRAK